MIRNLGPNCVISLCPPPNEPVTAADHHLANNYDKHNNYVTICEFCDQHSAGFKSNLCEHNPRHHCLNEEDIGDEFDSEFDVDNFDSLAGHQVCDSTHHSMVNEDNDHSYTVTHSNADFTHETENKYETIDGIKNSDESNCLDNSENNDKSEDEDNQNTAPVVNDDCQSIRSIGSKESEESNERNETNDTYDLPKHFEKSLSEV